MIPWLATYLPRLVAPAFPDLIWRVPGTARRLYLTFDDGPSPALTPRLLDVLGRHEAKATFFLLGRHALSRPQIVRDLAAAGHTLGNHTFSHPDPWRIPPDRLKVELRDTTLSLEDQIGQPVRFARPPYGHFTPDFRRWCAEAGQKLTMWDVMPGDFLPSSTEGRLERFMLSQVRPGSIIVLHDGPGQRLALERIVDTILGHLSAKGWSFPALPNAHQHEPA